MILVSFSRKEVVKSKQINTCNNSSSFRHLCRYFSIDMHPYPVFTAVPALSTLRLGAQLNINQGHQAGWMSFLAVVSLCICFYNSRMYKSLATYWYRSGVCVLSIASTSHFLHEMCWLITYSMQMSTHCGFFIMLYLQNQAMHRYWTCTSIQPKTCRFYHH